MACELIQFDTADGLRLDGALHTPDHHNVRPNAVLYLHGAASNFYSPQVLASLLPPLLAAGYPVLSINTRGHGLVNTIARQMGSQRGGAAYECVDECRQDIAGAVDWLLGRGMSKVEVVGHSLGAIKAIYAQAKQPHSAIARVVAISPPRLSYAALQHDSRGGELVASMLSAKRLVASGQGNELMQATFPLPMLVTAETYVDKYGAAERYNILNHLANLPCPALFIYGGRELAADNLAFSGLDEAIVQLAAIVPVPIEVEVVDQADHNYTQVGGTLAKVVVHWLEQSH